VDVTIRIGEWTLDAASNRLLGAEWSVALEPPVLEHLAAHPGRAALDAVDCIPAPVQLASARILSGVCGFRIIPAQHANFIGRSGPSLSRHYQQLLALSR